MRLQQNLKPLDPNLRSATLRAVLTFLAVSRQAAIGDGFLGVQRPACRAGGSPPLFHATAAHIPRKPKLLRDLRSL